MATPDLIIPDWPAPEGVRAIQTTRVGGVSVAPWDSLNLGDHVGDTANHVHENRQLLYEYGQLPRMPVWLHQVHGTDVASSPSASCADARTSSHPGEVCAVMTADCLPLLLTNRDATEVAAIHAGWKGLAAGILGATVAKMASDPAELIVWMGPAIGPKAFEVGHDVREAFLSVNPVHQQAFAPVDADHWLVDIYLLASQQLNSLGVHSIYGGGYCTVSESERFYSYRRDGVTGRMASLIWIQEKRS
ncbi:MAG: peptidoglycan editing factor PgeF [bacterium]